MFSWLVMWIICFQFYFLCLYLELALRPYFGDFVIEVASLPLLMLTVAFTVNKAFLDL